MTSSDNLWFDYKGGGCAWRLVPPLAMVPAQRALQDRNAEEGRSKREGGGEGESEVAISLCALSLRIFYFN
jgi:hypothetical protein